MNRTYPSLRSIARTAPWLLLGAACAEPGPTSAGSTARTPALFGYLWRGPCSYAFAGPSATTQVGAIDVFTAAMAPSSL